MVETDREGHTLRDAGLQNRIIHRDMAKQNASMRCREPLECAVLKISITVPIVVEDGGNALAKLLHVSTTEHLSLRNEGHVPAGNELEYQWDHVSPNLKCRSDWSELVTA